MLLSEAIAQVADDCRINSDRTDVSDRIKREINRVSSEIWDGYPWSFRWRTYRIVTNVDLTSGTVTATNGSRTITGSGTSFSSSHLDWYIYFPGDSIQNWYKILAYTSATQLELDVPYQGITGSGKSYILRRFDYLIPTEIWDLGNLTATADNRNLNIYPPSAVDQIIPTPFYSGYPHSIAIYSSDSMPTTYTTGTVSGTINTRALTGSGTSWLSNVYAGDKIVIGSYTYRVRNVNSDTEIILYNEQQSTSIAATYTITRQFGRILRLMWPSNNVHVIEIRGARKYTNLVDSDDSNEILYRYPNTVLLKVTALELKGQNDKRRREVEQEAEIALSRARAEDDAMSSHEQISAMFSYRSNNGYSMDRIR